jgi:hypothetical protein
LLTEIRVPVDVAPEFVIRDAELDWFNEFVLIVLNDIPVIVLVIEVASVVCPEEGSSDIKVPWTVFPELITDVP